MKLVKSILAAFYGMGVWVRNTLYEEHILHATTVDVPTICVGNLAVGGTGKTPHTEYLIRLLKDKYNIAVLSRGYKRKTSGFYLADEHATAEIIGDEPMQMHSKFPDVPFAVCENRVNGIRRLMNKIPDLQCVILDDAFQYRHLKAGLNILLTASDNLFVTDKMLPLGKLRDNKIQYLRANIIVVTKCPETLRPIDKRVIDTSLHLPTYQHLYFSQIQYGEMYPVFPKHALPVPERSKMFPLVLTGIEDPQPLFDHIKETHTNAELLAFPDHHVFTTADIELVRTAPYVITTEKDAARLQALKYYPDELKAKTFAIPITINFTVHTEAFEKQIITYVSETNRKRNK